MRSSAGIAGAYYASFKGGTFPDDFFFNISVFILCMVILGGMGNVWGVILGGGFLAYLNQEGLGNIGAQINENLGTNIDVPLYQFGIFGVILVLMMLFRPEGLIPSAPAQGGVRGGRGPGGLPLRRQRRARMSDLLVAAKVRKEFGGLVAVNDVDFTIPERRDRQPDRPERRRQDDVLQLPHGRLQADRRADRVRR